MPEEKQQPEKEPMVTCCQEGGSRCSICHAQIADGDDMCTNGHQIGRQYPASETR